MRHVWSCLLRKKCHLICRRRLTGSSETIFALSSAPGRAGVAVIRLSGPETWNALQMITNGKPMQPRHLLRADFRCTKTGELLDKGMVVWFPGPGSYTGEDVGELHVHGGPAVLSGILKALGDIPNMLPAQAGDFTKRALLSGKLSLTEVEGLGDLVDAETAAQRRLALREMGGVMDAHYQRWRHQLLNAVAELEAFIDFGEDELLDEAVLDKVDNDVENLRQDMTNCLGTFRATERIRSGLHVAILGKPNVGKSSLLNLLCQRPVAIVTPIAGTTRDPLEVNLDLDGYPIVLSDTAGLRDTPDLVEQEGVKRARSKLAQADVILYMIDLTAASSQHSVIQEIETALTDSMANGSKLSDWNSPIFVVLNKVDLAGSDLPEWTTADSDILTLSSGQTCTVIKISCTNNIGIDSLMNQLSVAVKKLCEISIAAPAVSNMRQKILLEQTLEALNSYTMSITQTKSTDRDIVLGAQYLRDAIFYLGKITGEIGVEDILDTLFKNFCIGK